MDRMEQQPKITEDMDTLEDAYEQLRMASLSEEQQRLLYLHVLDQFAAVPSYVEVQAQAFAREPEKKE